MPLVKALHPMDSCKASMGYLYKAMDKAKEAIETFYVYDAIKFHNIWEMIDRMWNGQLHKPLHAIEFSLNPKFFYGQKLDPLNGEINKGNYY